MCVLLRQGGAEASSDRQAAVQRLFFRELRAGGARDDRGTQTFSARRRGGAGSVWRQGLDGAGLCVGQTQQEARLRRLAAAALHRRGNRRLSRRLARNCQAQLPAVSGGGEGRRGETKIILIFFSKIRIASDHFVVQGTVRLVDGRNCGSNRTTQQLHLLWRISKTGS